MKEKNTYTLLSKRYPPESYVLIEEVSDASGFARSRSLDYMAIALWPSRGLSVTGIEKKSFRGDWLKEIKNPQKQENHFKYCDYFYLLTMEDNVAKLEEIPETWGWLHCTGKTIKTMKEAPKLDSLPIPKTFMVAMLRRAASKDHWIRKDTIEETIQNRIELRTKYLERDIETTKEELRQTKSLIREFENASGIEIKGGRDYWVRHSNVKIGAAVKLILEGGIEAQKDQLRSLLQQIKKIETFISTVIDGKEEISQTKTERVQAG